MKKILILILLAFGTQSFAQKSDPYLGIIPAPQSVKKTTGEFRITPETNLLTDSPTHRAVVYLAAYLKKNGLSVSITDLNTLDKGHAFLKNSIVLATNFKGDMAPEGYELTITNNQVTIHGHGAGLFYGVQSFIQLVHNTNPGYATLPCATIKDEPRFPYRGMHLDVVRHYFDINFIKKYLDVMAMYKLNNFHWHLTDDQGWRIQIMKYPKFTEVGSKRAQTKIGNFKDNNNDLYDNTPYEGYYTQDQIRDIVAYAHDRFINIVPEIEMPGHSQAAVAAYPEMSCDPTKTYKVMETWGVSNDVYCPSPTTFKILEDVLREVMELFPGRYIHIGGDECPKATWKASAYCRQLIADSALNNEEGLQSYFVRHMERFINNNGRSMVGWDEILEGGLAPNATVMSWRGEAGGIAAAQQNHDVIMTPGSGGLYFDHKQSGTNQEPLSIGGNAPLSKTYNYNPIPAVLSKDAQKHVIGVQANLWTEYIATPAKAEFMLLPRMLAMAETGWTTEGNKDYKNFSEQRIPHALAMLDAAGYNYRVPEALGTEDTLFNGAKHSIELTPLVEGAKIYYTLDGYIPRETDLLYKEPLIFTIPAGKYIDFQSITITPSGKRSIVKTTRMKN